MRSSLFIFIVIFSSCSKKTDSNPTPEAISFSGKALYSKPAEPKALAKSDSIISVIRKKGELTDDDYVEIGKQLVGTARYKLAVDIYTEGLSKYPNSYKLLRNRGHRFITLRKLENCIADLVRAEELIRAEADVMEYGLDGKPTATVRHQIWYHIGVYHFLKKDYSKSAEAFEKALLTSGTIVNAAGSGDWLYNCYQRANEKEKANKVIGAIQAETDVEKENFYYRRILLYKGLITPEELIDVNMAPDKMVVGDVTKLYGLANWYLYQGDKEKANTLYRMILTSDAWPAFAYAAAEIELSSQ